MFPTSPATATLPSSFDSRILPTVFETALDFTLRRETGGTKADGYRAGALHTDPKDPGRTTKYGIAERFHRGLDIAGLTLADATLIYWREYWLAGQCERLTPKAAMAHFEACVNPGIDAASRILQVVVGASPDGIVGDRTIHAVNRFVVTRGDSALAGEIISRRIVYFAADKDFPTYGLGWVRRCVSLAALVNCTT